MASKQKFLTVAVFVVAAGLFALFGPGGWLGSGVGGNETGGASGVVDPEDKELVALGQTVYAGSCASCHGAKLEGQPDWRTRNADGTLKAPPHDETGHTWHHPDADMFRYTKHGGQVLAVANFKSAMPGFRDTLSDREIWAVLSYIHTFWPPRIRERQRRLDAQSRVR